MIYANFYFRNLGIRNMEEKLTDSNFTKDIFTVLKPNTKYNNLIA